MKPQVTCLSYAGCACPKNGRCPGRPIRQLNAVGAPPDLSRRGRTLVRSHPSPRPRHHATNATHFLWARYSLDHSCGAAHRCRGEPPGRDTRTLAGRGGSLESLHCGGKHDFGGCRQRERNRTRVRGRNDTLQRGRNRTLTNGARSTRFANATQDRQDRPRQRRLPCGRNRPHGRTTRNHSLGYDHGRVNCG